MSTSVNSKVSGIATGDVLSDGSVPYTGAVQTSVGTLTSLVPNGASAVGFDFATPAYSTAGALLARVKNNATVALTLDKDAKLSLGGGTLGAGSIAMGQYSSIYEDSSGLTLALRFFGIPFIWGNNNLTAVGGNGLRFSDSPAVNSNLFALFCPAANILDMRVGTAAQTMRIYNTYTDASNYERGFLRWASNVLEIGAEAAGTGTARVVKILGNVAVDLWASAALVASFTSASGLPITTYSGSGAYVRLDNNTTNAANGGFKLGNSGGTIGWLIGAGSNSPQISPLSATGYITGYAGFNTNASPFLVKGSDASANSGNWTGGDLRFIGGAGFGSGARGVVALGYDGTTTSRVTVRNTIFALNGYTTTAVAATTTELPTSGDFGLHKNSGSGAVHLCYNDGGTIKSVALV